MTTTETGSISIHTENIFPIIKKFLYSDHEIFLRELVSNAVDATRKLQYLSARGEMTGELGELKIKIEINAEEGTLSILDAGVGMTGEEVKKYINQIAFSGATEFLNKYEEKPEGGQLIGNFGLGFYSAFMVAQQVELTTRSWQPEAEAVQWKCDGSTEFSLAPAEKQARGTEVKLFLAEDAKEFLEGDRIRGILEKYCRFMPIEIEFEGKIINETHPLWMRKPAELTDADYIAFYEKLYPYQEKPLFWIHLNVDYPFTLTGILYFPRFRPEIDPNRNRIHLYSRQVFITDAVKEVVPEFLMLLEGVLDSPDIPLNVSRSSLQGDPNVKKINAHITKKVADKLEEWFKEDRAGFEQKWEDLQLFVKYGMLSEEKFKERGQAFCLVENLEGKKFTLPEYREFVQANQTDKTEQVVWLYAGKPEQQDVYIQAARKRGYDVLKLGGLVDTHFTGLIERVLDKVRLTAVDAGSLDQLIEKDTPRISLLAENEEASIKKLFETCLQDFPGWQTETRALTSEEAPVLLTQSEFMRRMREMSASGQMTMMGALPESWQLVINTAHPSIQALARQLEGDHQNEEATQLTDLALLAAGKLQGERLSSFVNRSFDWIRKS